MESKNLVSDFWATGWQNQGYGWYIVPRTYTEKVGPIDWRDQLLIKRFFLKMIEKK